MIASFVLLGGVAPRLHGKLFEFVDDFETPWQEQREPYEERIETERHDFTQSAVTVGRGVFQAESGYTFFYRHTQGETESSHTFPEMLLRFGLTEDIEFRLRWNHVWQFVDESADQTGSEDLRYSFKFQITRAPPCGMMPTSALELRGTAPTGSEEFTTNRAEFSLDYIYQWQLFDGVSLAGSTGFGTNGFADFEFLPDDPANDRFVALSQSIAIGAELTASNTMYAEWYWLFSHGLADEFAITVFNMGVDHYLTDDLVLDLRVGMGLSADADDLFAGVGGGWRF